MALVNETHKSILYIAEESHLKLTAYLLPGEHAIIRPAPVAREWMHATASRFAYRCLPLNIANSYGWEILCPHSFTACWDGGIGQQSIHVSHEQASPIAVSHFGSGILTIKLPCLFVTEEGYSLYVQGPINQPKDAISPLSALVETDWLPYTFTMNWQFTRPNFPIHFAKGEPFCHVFPTKLRDIELVDPLLTHLSSNPELETSNNHWTESRESFLQTLNECPKTLANDAWQKDYFMGRDPGTSHSTVKRHRTKLELKTFKDET